ncbi:natural cytotoxicity triggering receptor 3 [Emydura macquarii macquarii]|uniref:natural cytotoxicity triggering receptor 3 n=1 Tax=Emydura macquarii macquarii TaxID=1129001 RepID=UPI00352B5C62
MEQLPALSPVLCLVLLIPSWGAAAAEIPAGCRRAEIRNAGSSTQTPDGLRVSQQPRSLNATAGDNLTLTCTFQYKKGIKAKAVWLRGSGEDVVLDSNHPFYRGRLHVSSLDEITQGKVTLTLSELEERDSGLYLCCIEIYTKGTGTGEGTELRVTQGKPSATGVPRRLELCPDYRPLFYRAVVSLLLVILCSLGIILSLQPWNGVPVSPAVGAGSEPPQARGKVTLI